MKSLDERSVRDATAAQLVALGAATLYEASKSDIACDPSIRPSWPGAVLCGPAYPVRCHPADNLPIHHAVERAAPGDVLVIDCGGRLAGYIGDLLATACKARGIAGIAIDDGTRDVHSLVKLGFPVFSRGISILRTGKHMRQGSWANRSYSEACPCRAVTWWSATWTGSS